MTTLITRHSETGGKQPDPGQVAIGELCLNTVDGKLYTSSDGTNVVPVVGGDGGGGGELPNGSAEGQMLSWSAAGTPTWTTTDVIKTTTDDNITINGPQFSAAYRLTVNGNTYMAGTVDMTGQLTAAGVLCDDLVSAGHINTGNCSSTTYTVTTTTPTQSNNLTSKSYVDSVASSKVNSSGGTLTSGTLTSSCNINGLPTSSGSAWFVMANVSGTMQKGGLVNGAAQVQAVLEQFAIALGATPAQMTAVQTAIAPLTVPSP